ncbi:MAG: NAD-binding protein [Actinomycetota bacterium]|nr:NAD-binding protein [Actinomycetota bacterium]
MHVVVVGCGRVGSELATRLEAEGHGVAVIDKDRNSFRRLPKDFGGKAILGFGFDRGHLEQAGVAHGQGALAAVTNGDNSNIVTARIARETYEVPYVAARIYDPRRAVIYQRLGIPTVAAVAWTTDQVMRRLFPEQSITEWTDATGSLSLIERALPDRWAGRRMAEMGSSGQWRVVSFTRAGQPSRLPGPDAVGQEGDILHVLIRGDAVDQFEQRMRDGES